MRKSTRVIVTSGQSGVVAGLGLVSLALAFCLLVTASALAEQTPSAEPRAGSSAVDVPAGWMSQVQGEIQASEYRVTWQERTSLPGLERAYQAPNRAHDFRTYFTEAGIRVISRTERQECWEWGLAARGESRHTGLDEGSLKRTLASHEVRWRDGDGSKEARRTANPLG